MLDLLALPGRFKPLNLSLEMRGFVVTNSSELYRVASFRYFTIIILQRVYENGIKTQSPKLRNLRITLE